MTEREGRLYRFRPAPDLAERLKTSGTTAMSG